MCTAVSWNAQYHYFGRNLDLEHGYRETVTITPRKYPFAFRMMPEITDHYAMIGIATVDNGYPLYYEATNEAGLSMAGLNFPGLAKYCSPSENRDNVASFELIPWFLGQCANVKQAQALIARLNITDQAFSPAYPPTPLHWILADKERSIVLETTKDGLRAFENPIGILTNSPSFDYHMYHLCDYLQISADAPLNRFCETLDLKPYSGGMGGMGLPGDYSSASRFVKAAFVKLNSTVPEEENACVSHFFRILGSVVMPRGTVRIGGKNEITRYSSCCNTHKGIYYYMTYDNPRIVGVNMHSVNLQGQKVVNYPLLATPDIHYQN